MLRFPSFLIIGDHSPAHFTATILKISITFSFISFSIGLFHPRDQGRAYKRDIHARMTAKQSKLPVYRQQAIDNFLRKFF